MELFRDEFEKLSPLNRIKVARNPRNNVVYKSKSVDHAASFEENASLPTHLHFLTDDGVFSRLMGVRNLVSSIHNSNFGSIAILPFKFFGSQYTQHFALDFAECLEVQLIDIFDVVAVSESLLNYGSTSARVFHDLDVDYIVTGSLRVPVETGRNSTASLLIRLINHRKNGRIVWAGRFETPPDLKYCTELIPHVVDALKWFVLLSDNGCSQK